VKVAFGLKAHSGWAALVVVGRAGGGLVVVDRRRLELVEEEWAKQPYHAAEEMERAAGRKRVELGIRSARRVASREIAAAVARERERGNQVAAGAVLVGEAMPDWSADEILAVHFRMHKAEGALFRDALLRAVAECGLPAIGIPEKTMAAEAKQALGPRAPAAISEIAGWGKTVGPPWGKDQKDAALAAAIALS
jgi:hypothetical protein